MRFARFENYFATIFTLNITKIKLIRLLILCLTTFNNINIKKRYFKLSIQKFFIVYSLY